MAIKKIIHMADIHIRPYQRLEEYSDKLKELNIKLKEETKGLKNDEVRIIIAGDTVHSKNSITNELIAFVSTWIRELEQFGKVIVISGNHDLMVDNKSRVDTMSAIFTASNFSNAIHLDGYLGYESGIMHDDNITWALYSIFSDYRRPDIEQAKRKYQNSTVVGLYHGPIVGASLNNGTSIDSGVDINIFEGCDVVMAGDIHKRQELKIGNTKVLYPGSLIQQNFGETVTQHGLAIWDAEKMEYKFVDLSDEYSLYNFEINSPEDIDENKEILINY